MLLRFFLMPCLIFCGAFLFSGCSNNPDTVINSGNSSNDTANQIFDSTMIRKIPILGWNSFDAYHADVPESTMMANLDVFIRDLRPKGYEYFIVDIGWAGDDRYVYLDKYGRNVPDSVWYPNGLEPLIKKAHQNGVKVGLWIVRGVNKRAVRLKMPILGTPYTCDMIADSSDTSDWCMHNFGVDMTKPGAQEYYDSKAKLFAEWGIDFIKYDDVHPHPDEFLAITKAFEQYAPNIYLSISPGPGTSLKNADLYRKADMVRLTADVWDNREDLQKVFDVWQLFEPLRNSGFTFDFDMIPFGYFQKCNNSGDNSRFDNLTPHQKQTFMTQRALAAAPLIMGGALRESGEEFHYITNEKMLNCNQNGVCGKRIYKAGNIEVWKTVK